MQATRRPSISTGGRLPVIAVVGLSLVAAAISAFRAIRTDLDGGSSGVVLASMAAVLALVAAATATRSLRSAALPLTVAVLLELLVLNGGSGVAPPRLVNAIPLLFALSLALVGDRLPVGRSPEVSSPPQTIAITVALASMVPIGFAYLATGLVAPMPDVIIAYALYALLLGSAVWLARRRSWWVVAVPFLSAGLWPLMVWAGETFLDWSG